MVAANLATTTILGSIEVKNDKNQQNPMMAS
jgi:hypothetical protein